MKHINKILFSFIKFIYISLSLMCLYSCDIERIPKASMSAKEINSNPDASLDALLNGCYSQLKGWADVMHRCGEYAGDNIMIRGASSDDFYEFISYSRTPNNYRLQTFWDNSYKIIAQTSNILKLINKNNQSKEVNEKLGECYFLRGMMYFYLCRAYGRPYYQSPEKNLGVPIVNGTPDNVISDNLILPERSTVKETYEQAIKDLIKAEEMLPTGENQIRASKVAAEALLSRVYLFMSGTWDNPNITYAKKTVYYATKVINSNLFQLLPRGEFMKYNTYLPEKNKETIFAVKRVASEFSGDDHFYGVGGMYAVIGGMGWGEIYASAKYLKLLDETGRNDWRSGHVNIVDARANFIEPQYVTGEGGSYKEVFRFIATIYENGNIFNYKYIQAPIVRGNNITCTYNNKRYILKVINASQDTYSITYDGHMYKGVIDYKMKLNREYPMFYITKSSREGEESHLHSPIISRLGEIYLNRAEAYAKLGNYNSAKTDLNLIRNRSIPGAGYTSLDNSNVAKRIDKERQLELAYQAERSYDVYRNGGSLTRAYPGAHNVTEVIMPTDYRVIYFIPQTAINSYPGKITQNPTE